MTDATNTKFCKDCMWCERKGFLRKVKTYAKCFHPASRVEYPPDIVTGGISHDRPEYCSVMRLADMPCGTDADLFEPRR